MVIQIDDNVPKDQDTVGPGTILNRVGGLANDWFRAITGRNSATTDASVEVEKYKKENTTNVTFNTVTVTDVLTAIVDAQTDRVIVWITNTSAQPIRLWNLSTGTGTNGMQLSRGEIFQDEKTTTGWWGISPVASPGGNADIRYIEVRA